MNIAPSLVIENFPHVPPNAEFVQAADPVGFGNAIRNGILGALDAMLFDQVFGNLVRIVFHRLFYRMRRGCYQERCRRR